MKNSILFSIAISIASFAQSQDITVHDVTFTLNDSSLTPSLFAPKTLFILPSASFLNSGSTFEIKGDISNLGSFTSSGSDILSGTNNQFLFGNFSGPNYFGILNKQTNTTILCNTDIDCNRLIFSGTGFVDVSQGKTITIKGSDYNSLLGYSNVKCIDVGMTGLLKRNVSDTTLGHTYSFPVRNASYGYRNIDIQLYALGTRGPESISVQLQPISGSVQYSQLYPTGFSQSVPGLCSSGANSQWVEFSCISQNGWKLSGPNDYEYSLQGNHEGCGIDVRRLVTSPTGIDHWTENISNVIGDSAKALCNYSDWTGTSTVIPGGPYRGFGYISPAGNSGISLPVTLTSITARIFESCARIQWSTLIEINNSHFILERSTDGITFLEIGTQAGNGSTAIEHHYTFDDCSIIENTHYYYRIRQIDFDGKNTLSDMVSFIIKSKHAFEIDVFPNPTTGKITILKPVSGSHFELFIYNSLGQKILVPTTQSPISITGTIIGPPGLYSLYLITETDTLIKKMIKY